MADVRFQQVMQPCGGGSFFEGYRQTSAQPLDELKDRSRFRLQDAFHDPLARAVHDGNRDRCLVNIHANILFLLHNGAPFGKLWSEQSQLTAKWAPFILRDIGMLRQLTWACAKAHLY